ncbi:MAG: metallophosphoesterase family protein [Bacteroidaceae bacterium]|nr:metallophosphoesterase family protein [Bacteroidaceae bacterium]
MKRIGLLSDTHGWWDERYAKHFAECNEIWHAGDIGSMLLVERLQEIAPLRAVYGNIDGGDVRRMFTEVYRFRCEEVEVVMTHIGGYPGHYSPAIYKKLVANPPQLFTSGHSHILKVMYDKQLGCLHINPGAAGIQGFQTVRTLVRFTVDGKEIKDLEVVELSSPSGKGL